MRVLFSVQPATGHLQPLVPLCRQLAANGHEVKVVSAPSFVPAVASFGLEAEPLGLDWLRADAARFFRAAREMPAEARYIWVLTELYAGETVRRLLPDLERLAERWCPDLVIRDQMEFAAWLFAERHDIPHVSYGYGLGFQERDRRVAGPAIAERRREAGLAPDPELHSLFRHLRFEFAPACYRPAESRPIPTTRHIRYRPCDKRRGDRSPEWLGELGGRPLVVATLGTNYNRVPGLFELIIEALAALPVEVVVTSGDTRAPEDLGPLPRNVRAVSYVPLSELLPHADAIVCHAGFNTIMTAALAAVPIVLIPIESDQPLQAVRCEALGIGRSLARADLTVPGLREVVRDVLAEPGYRESMAAFRSEIEALPDLPEVATLLERLAEEGRLERA
ncbi:N-glycosyltransferase [Tistlia consotensis]|uniref:N-glycosyltransferase n=1 Tax=Tistlia consotensis USBA 355 TaxID=560819 RepID=A0A1Y6CTN0_9PROT|nr:glycosyltransferase [Tistlia consotensis]SMF73552.1 N-glycosyltransferase [Tistlia consotensis USBA 355]SNS30083.1 N-glycosyltransferase [Tistlia consotensis]